MGFIYLKFSSLFGPTLTNWAVIDVVWFSKAGITGSEQQEKDVARCVAV